MDWETEVLLHGTTLCHKHNVNVEDRIHFISSPVNYNCDKQASQCLWHIFTVPIGAEILCLLFWSVHCPIPSMAQRERSIRTVFGQHTVLLHEHCIFASGYMQSICNMPYTTCASAHGMGEIFLQHFIVVMTDAK